MNDNKKFKVVGTNVKKSDAEGLVCGKPMFVADHKFDGLLVGKILTSPIAHGIITSIDTTKAEKLPGVKAVLTYKNVPRNPHTTAGQGWPEPSAYDCYCLDKKMRFVGDRVAAVAAETKDIAEEALSLIKVEFDEFPAILDVEKAMDKGAPIIHDEEDIIGQVVTKEQLNQNICAHVTMNDVGNLESAFKSADIVVEGKYYLNYAQHTPMEPHVTLAAFDNKGRVHIITSTQVPFHVRRIVALSLGLKEKDIRVTKPRIGGGFGAKQEVLEDIVVALALAARKPVLLEYTRWEETIASRTRHPQVVKQKLGFKKDGTLVANALDCLMNSGAYGGHALTVVCNSGSKCLPLYRCDNVHFEAFTVYTNMPVGGVYRGYGATQGYFAQETLFDEAAVKLGIDPIELRKKNHIQVGEGSPVFKALGEGREGVEQKINSCGLDKCLELGAKEIGYYEKKGKTGTGRFRKGIGMCALMQGSSIPFVDMGAASIKMNEDGSFNLLLGAADLGTGADTVLSQIAAETLCVSYDKIIPFSADTDYCPFDVGAYASSTTYLTGTSVRKTAEAVKDQILDVAATILKESKDKLRCEDSHVISESGKKIDYSKICYHSLYSENMHQIAATKSHITECSPPPFSAHFAEVEVDIETGLVKVLKYVAAVDCGTAIHPILAEGQTEGGVLNGISYALCEEIVFDEKGKPKNGTFKDYKIYNTIDVPEIKTILVPTYEPTGPYGAKSVSEICINGPVPAIANAIYDAIGIRLKEIPFKPEAVLKAIKEKGIK